MGYQRITVRLAVGLAAFHTWAASVLPVLLGGALSIALSGRFDWVLFYCVLVISVLMQSSVNALNDYYDFIKHTDTVDNSDDPSDAVLVYNKLNPKHVLALGLGFLAAAGLIGIYVIWRCGIVPLIIGSAGGVTIACYSAGRTPVSYLPLGEVVSGVVMGGLITLAVYHVLTGELDWGILYYAIPLIIGIGMIMFTNNTSDIERDIPAGRRTLPILLGRKRAVTLYKIMIVVWAAAVFQIVFRQFRASSPLLPLMALWAGPSILRLWKLPFTPDTRYQAMPAILSLNLRLGLFYIVMAAVSRGMEAYWPWL